MSDGNRVLGQSVARELYNHSEKFELDDVIRYLFEIKTDICCRDKSIMEKPQAT